MAKPTTKPSDRGASPRNPEPGGPPGTRATQRGTKEQLDAGPEGGDPATAFEREEQEKLPPRGDGSQHNQGEDHGARVQDKPEGVADEGELVGAGRQSGGNRGPSAPKESS